MEAEAGVAVAADVEEDLEDREWVVAADSAAWADPSA